MKYLLILFTLILTSTQALPMGTAPHLPGIVYLQTRIADELNNMDNDLAQAARKLSALGLQGDKAGKILLKIYDDHNSVVDVATIDLNGNLLLIQPKTYQGSEGQNISGQPHFALLKKTKKPLLSGIFKTVEGFWAVSLARPVFSPRGEPIGFVSIVLKPDALMGNIIKPYLTGLPSVEALAIQKDGKIIYDKDILQVGRMTFSDPIYQSYPDLLALAKRTVNEPNGAGTYTFPAGPGKGPVRKATEWTTIGLYGTEWRLIVSKGTGGK